MDPKLPNTAPVGTNHCVTRSPELSPHPNPRWVYSFRNQVYRSFPLQQGHTYGPFYRVGERPFSPRIGDPEDPSTDERQCFWGIERPSNAHHARVLYNIPETNTCGYIHTFTILVPGDYRGQPIIFYGPVEGGCSFQFSPNRHLVDLHPDHFAVSTEPLEP
jgi:hypothetical protein